MDYNILIIEDELNMVKVYNRLLKKEGFNTDWSPTGAEGISLFSKKEYDLVLLDLMLPDMNGNQVLENLQAIDASCPVIMITAFGDISNAVTTVQSGAFDYLTKPAKVEDIVYAVKKAIEWKKIHSYKNKHRNKGFIANSTSMKRIANVVDKIASRNTNVLITGETGTGKSHLASEIHRRSNRSKQNFITVNCPAIPETLLESVLFGHKKGSFTGALNTQIGQFEAADKGVIFLDEIGEISPSVQAKLLQVCQEKQITRIGETKPISVDVKIIAATNRDIEKMVETGEFREDLYFRLNTIQIEMPPLRERTEDIPEIIKNILTNLEKQFDAQFYLEPAVLPVLMSYHWEGNIRQLEHVLERAALLSEDYKIRVRDLEINEKFQPTSNSIKENNIPTKLPETLENLEKEMVITALQKANYNITAASASLGISRQNLQYRINKLNLN